MNPLISVIIPCVEDDTYLIRGLNSIKRQKYTNYEIIYAGSQVDLADDIVQEYDIEIVGDKKKDYYQNLNKSMQIARGEYYFFFDVDMVLASDLLEVLVKQNRETIFIPQFFVCNGEELDKSEIGTFAIFGKLLLAEYIKKNSLEFDKEEIYPDITFLASYLNVIIERKVLDNTFIYISKERAINENVELISKEKLYNLLESVETCSCDKESWAFFLSNIIEKVLTKKVEVADEIVLWIALYLLENHKEEIELSYNLARKYLVPIFKTCQENKNEDLWRLFQQYFSIEISNYFEQCLLGVFNIDTQNLEFIKEMSVNEYLFYSRTLKKEDVDSVSNREDEILSAIEKLSIKIEEKKENVLPKVSEQIKIEKEMLQGIELGDYVVHEYQAGRLGVKYIFMSFIAWMEFKIKK